MAEARWIRGLVDVFRAEAGTVLGVRSSSFVIPGADSLHQPPVQHGNVCKHRIRFHFRFKKLCQVCKYFPWEAEPSIAWIFWATRAAEGEGFWPCCRWWGRGLPPGYQTLLHFCSTLILGTGMWNWLISGLPEWTIMVAIFKASYHYLLPCV